MTRSVQPDYGAVNRENLGEAVSVESTKWWNISLVSQGRNRKTIGEKHSKNSKKTTRQTTSAPWRILTKLRTTL